MLLSRQTEERQAIDESEGGFYIARALSARQEPRLPVILHLDRLTATQRGLAAQGLSHRNCRSRQAPSPSAPSRSPALSQSEFDKPLFR